MSKHHETPIGHCLGCVPVRTGVAAFSWFILFLSVCAVLGLVTEDTRILVGGYSAPWSKWFTDVCGVLGIVFSLMGLIGLSDNHPYWVRLFAYYATFRVVLRIYSVWADYGIIHDCETFGLSSVTSQYNAAMETVVLHGRCSTTRLYYAIISALDIFFSLYGIWNTFFWCRIVETSPMYHIALDDTKPLRIYTGYSTVGHPEAPPIRVHPPTSPGVSSVPVQQWGDQSAAHLQVPPTLPPGAPQNYGTTV